MSGDDRRAGAYDLATAMEAAMSGDDDNLDRLPPGTPISWAGTSVAFPPLALALGLKSPTELAEQVADQRAHGINVTGVPWDLEPEIEAAMQRRADGEPP